MFQLFDQSAAYDPEAQRAQVNELLAKALAADLAAVHALPRYDAGANQRADLTRATK